MLELIESLAIPIGVIAALGLVLVVARSKGRAPAFAPANEREEQLALRLARTVHCHPAQALPAIRRELKIAPDQTDETILKRAEYHYRQDLPDAPCPVFRSGGPPRG